MSRTNRNHPPARRKFGAAYAAYRRRVPAFNLSPRRLRRLWGVAEDPSGPGRAQLVNRR